MKNIVLFCAAGMSTSLMVTKMQNAAKEKGFDCTIAAYSLSEMDKYGPGPIVFSWGPRSAIRRIRWLPPSPTSPL